MHDAGTRYVIVGGVAAALHGGTRVTFDLDVVPSLEPNCWRKLVELLWSLGARPRIPESLDRICNVALVQQWREEKGMLALNFRTPDGAIEVDLMVGESDRFEELRSRAVAITIGARTYHVVALDDLIAMKETAGRPQDLFDVVVANGEEGGAPRLKPWPDGYQSAAERLGIAPERCLVVGDRQDADGAAAELAGMEFRLVK